MTLKILYMKNRFLLLVLCAMLAGCNNKPKGEVYEELVVPETVEVNLEIVNDSIVLPRVISDVIYHDGRLLLLCLLDGKWVHIYNIAQGRIEKSFITNGRGPEELISGHDLTFDRKNNTLNVLDLMQRKILTMDFDEVFGGGNPKVTSEYFKEAYASVIPFGGKLLTYNTHSYEDPRPQVRFSLQDKDGTELDAYRKYPIADSVLAFMVSIPYHIDVSPDQTKMVAASSRGGIIEWFDIGSDKFKPIDILYLSEPHLKDGRALLDGEKTDYCFVDIWTNDKLVYTVYGGHGYKSKTDRVVVFDWKGNPRKLYQTEYRIHLLCLDEETNTAYVITETDPEKATIIGKFSL